MLKLLFACSLFFIVSAAQAASCTDIRSCAKAMQDITQQRYIWDVTVENNKINSTDIELNKDNADLIFTAMLDQVGLTRLPVGDGKTYRIVRGALIKEIETPITEVSYDHAPKFGNTWDWVSMRYKLKPGASANLIEQSYRLHLPRESRMQADENGGFLIITATIPVARHMYEMLKAADRPLSAAMKVELKKREREQFERMKAANATK
jgi:hypothetical protein